MSKTEEDLKAAFAGESQANRKYLAFSRVAEKEGKPNLAKLFRATAEGETVHALNHLNVLREVKSSKENLEAAIAGETYEIETMYPGFIADAQADNDGQAVISFTGANNVEKVHQAMYKVALEKVEAGEDVEESEYHVCSVCGNLLAGELPDECPICKAKKDKFYKVA